MNENTVSIAEALINQEPEKRDEIVAWVVDDMYKHAVKNTLVGVGAGASITVGIIFVPKLVKKAHGALKSRKAKKEAAKAKCVDEDGNDVPCDVEE